MSLYFRARERPLQVHGVSAGVPCLMNLMTNLVVCNKTYSTDNSTPWAKTIWHNVDVLRRVWMSTLAGYLCRKNVMFSLFSLFVVLNFFLIWGVQLISLCSCHSLYVFASKMGALRIIKPETLVKRDGCHWDMREDILHLPSLREIQAHTAL